VAAIRPESVTVLGLDSAGLVLTPCRDPVVVILAVIHQGLLSPTGAHWLDDPSDLSSKDATRQYPVDDPLLSCNQKVGGSSPPASSHKRR
jgi:hypothetical protein